MEFNKSYKVRIVLNFEPTNTFVEVNPSESGLCFEEEWSAKTTQEQAKLIFEEGKFLLEDFIMYYVEV